MSSLMRVKFYLGYSRHYTDLLSNPNIVRIILFEELLHVFEIQYQLIFGESTEER